MRLSEVVVRFAAGMAKLYKRMPVEFMKPFLRNAYHAVLRILGEHSSVVKNIDGINYELDLKEVIDSAMYYEGAREPSTSRALMRLCKPGDVVFDISANVGSHSLPIANHVGSTGLVYSFEPVPWALRKIKRNIELNKLNNILVEPIALSDERVSEVEVEFRASFKIDSKSGVGKNGKICADWWKECEKVVISMDTIDAYVVANNVEKLDLIKLDVDGFEGKVIRGAKDTLKNLQPVLIMEVAPAWIEMRGDNIKHILNNLMEFGYKFYEESDFEEIEDLFKRIDNLPAGGGFNIIASTRHISII